MSQKDKILVLCDALGPTTIDQDLSEDLKTEDWETEANVMNALRARGYPFEMLGIFNDTNLIREKIKAYKPDVIFNLVERFKHTSAFDQNIVSFLELQDVPFTGCGSLGLALCKDKGISKQILSYHRIRVPEFAVFPRGKTIKRPKRLRFPIFIKPLKEEASYGIAQASFVEDDGQFKERVEFLHERHNQDVIAEEYIDGRELYVGVLGNDRLRVFPVRELVFKEAPPDEPKFASYKAKWDDAYRKRWGIASEFAAGLDNGLMQRIQKTCKKIYRYLAIKGCARIDLRLTPANEVVFIEANPNPMLAKNEDFALAAAKANIPYTKLIERIIKLGKAAFSE